MAKLYEIAERYSNLLELLDNEEIEAEVLKESLESVEGELCYKLENIAKIIKNVEGEVDIFKQEEKRLSVKRKALENKVKNIKNYAEETLKSVGEKKIKAGTFTFSIQKNAPSVYIKEGTSIPSEFLIEQEPTVDKNKIKQCLKDGEILDFAELKNSESLRIR